MHNSSNNKSFSVQHVRVRHKIIRISILLLFEVAYLIAGATLIQQHLNGEIYNEFTDDVALVEIEVTCCCGLQDFN